MKRWKYVSIRVKVEEQECAYCGAMFWPQIIRKGTQGELKSMKFIVSNRVTCSQRCAAMLKGEKSWERYRERPREEISASQTKGRNMAAMGIAARRKIPYAEACRIVESRQG